MIKWNEYTWYSKWASLIFFILVLPILTFYIGTQYEEAKNVSEVVIPQNVVVKKSTTSISSLNVYKNDFIEFQYPQDFSVEEIDEVPYKTLKISNKDYYFLISNSSMGFNDDWKGYAPAETVTENGGKYYISYMQKGIQYGIVGSKDDVPFYLAFNPTENQARDTTIHDTFRSILRSLKIVK